MQEYAVYKGESLLVVGTLEECAESLGVKEDTIRHYMTPAYKRKLASRKRSRNARVVVRLDDED